MLTASGTECLDVASARAQAWEISVVEKLNEVGSPPQKHWVPRGEQGSRGSAKAPRPSRYGTKRRPRPLKRATARAHLAWTGEEARSDVVVRELLCSRSVC